MVFRDNRTACPRCGSGLGAFKTSLGYRFSRCGQCLGNWVELLVLRQLLEQMRSGAGMPLFTPAMAHGQALPCPACRTPMRRVMLHELELDQCARHGVWFDGVELEQTLYRYALDQS